MRKFFLFALLIGLPFINFSQIVSIGTGTLKDNVSPWDPYYAFSYVQTIYLQSEIAAGGSVTSVSYYYAGSALDNSDVLTIYMGHTAKSSFSNETDWKPVSKMTKVFDDTLKGYTVPGWITINLTTPFVYNNTDNLIIAVDENKAFSNDFTRFNSTELTGSHRVLSYSGDNDNPDPASPPVGVLGDVIGNIQITGLTAQGCQAVKRVDMLSVTTNSAIANWSAPLAGSPVNTYDWELRTSGTAGSGSAGLVSAGNTDTAGVNLTSLLPGTNYTFFVRSECTSGAAAWSVGANFTTVCAAISVFPYIENFDNVTEPELPACITAINNNNDDDKWQTYSAFGTNGSNAAGLYTFDNAGNNDDYLVLPQMTLTGNQRLKFSLRTYGLEPNDYRVVLSKTTADPAEFTTEIVPLTVINSDVQTPVDWIDLSAYTGNVFIAVHVPGGGLPGYTLYIDDIRVDNIPTCDTPVSVKAHDFTTTGAQVSWTPPQITNPAGYEVYYSTSDTLPTASTVPSVTGITGIGDTFTGLAVDTKYNFAIRSTCGSGGVSLWTNFITVQTLCSPTALPYSQDFESASVPSIPDCTSAENAGTGNDWTVMTSPGSRFDNNTLVYSHNQTNPADAWFYTRGINLTAGTSYRLKFKYGNNVRFASENLEVKYGPSTSSADMNDLIVAYPGIQLQGSAFSSTDFTPAFTGVYYIGFHAFSAANQQQLYVDDILLTVTPTCDVPSAIKASNITSAAAQIDWATPTVGTPSSYDLYYSTSDTPPDSLATPSVAGLAAPITNLSGLTENTPYYVWVRTDCGGGDVSVWTSAFSFSTVCTSVDVPYLQDFESASPPDLPSCTTVENDGLANAWNIVNYPGYGFTSNTLHYGDNFMGHPADTWFFTRGLNLEAGKSYRLRYKYGSSNSYYTESMEVKYGTLASGTAMTGLIADYPAINSDALVATVTDFIPSATGIYYIGFHAYSAAYQSDVFVDDISVKVTPSCDYPFDLVFSNITTTSAQVDWTAPALGIPASYDIYYSTSDTAPADTATPSVPGIASTSYQFDNLAAGTDYSVWVRSNCGGGQISEWSLRGTFTTECDIITPTVAAENFNTPPLCWGYAQGYLSDPITFAPTPLSRWTTGNFANGLDTINNAAKLEIYDNTQDWLTTPGYDLGFGANYQLEFDLAMTVSGDTATGTFEADDKFAVLISADNGISWSTANTLRTWDASTPISPSGEHIVLDLSAYSGVVKLAFYGESLVADNDNEVFVDNVAVTSKGSLPVTISNFEGQKDGSKNVLTWTTKTEQNNKGFELQRSADGIHFSMLAFVYSKASSGTSSSNISYGFADTKPFIAATYYRLKQVDTDGKFSLSKTILIKGNRANTIVLSNVFPNPVHSQLTVTVASPANEKVSVIVTDIAGKLVLQEPVQLTAGDNRIYVNTARLLSGTYVIKMICANGCEAAISKFIKQ